MTIRVLLADDHKIVREGLRLALGAADDVEVVGEAEDGRIAVDMAEELKPDVVVMDLAMPSLNGVDATVRIRKSLPEVQVVVLSMHATDAHVRPAIKAGANGYLLKGAGLSDLLTAIRAVHRGEKFYSPVVTEMMKADKSPAEKLTTREREVLQLVGEGRSSPEIAKLLHVSVKTVEGHRSRLMTKLEAKNVAGLVRNAVRMGLVSEER